jgi:hypothetical protein
MPEKPNAFLGTGAARSCLDSTLKENHLDPGDGIRMENGAEIHYLTGGPVIRMAMIRKDNRLVRLKVNQDLFPASHESEAGPAPGELTCDFRADPR